MKLTVNTTNHEACMGRVFLPLSEEELFSILGGRTIEETLEVFPSPRCYYKLEVQKQVRKADERERNNREKEKLLKQN